MLQRGFLSVGIPGFLLVFAGCRSIVESDITYVDCFPVADSPYAEPFSENYAVLGQRCWQEHNFGGDSAASVYDEDLLIKPNGPAHWSQTEAAPLVSIRFDGDFLMATRAELAVGANGDHCFDPENAAGLVARDVETGAWASLLLQPAFDPTTPLEECSDDAEPPARALVRSMGFVEDVAAQLREIGFDGEADIALCRLNDQLLYFYRDVDALSPETKWVPILMTQQTVGRGPMDVGLTTTAKDTTLGAEGHFASAIVFRELETDGCRGAFERLEIPEDP